MFNLPQKRVRKRIDNAVACRGCKGMHVSNIPFQVGAKIMKIRKNIRIFDLQNQLFPIVSFRFQNTGS